MGGSAARISEFTWPGGTVVIDLYLNSSIALQYATVTGYGICSDSGMKREKFVFRIVNLASDSQVSIRPSTGLLRTQGI